jgi:hypothetical protein
VSLRPYPTLALFIVPVILLEPVKLVATYLTAAGHIVGGLMILIVGELLKLLLIERLFSVSRDKLMTIPVFAWCYDKGLSRPGLGWISAGMATHASVELHAKHALQKYVLEFKTARKQKRLYWQSH